MTKALALAWPSLGVINRRKKLWAPEAQRENQDQQFGVGNPSSIGIKGEPGQRALDDCDSLVFTPRATALALLVGGAIGREEKRLALC